ncbi:phytanoyl-CoA dioxygenase family protein [Fulvivirga marina]|uniref:phytanoyl-CoA dioxygenase family protein n=1 Tax=Fulvivirga marina TaxID=2494733 RepID=UPI003743CD12
MPANYKGHPIIIEPVILKKGEVHFHHCYTWHGSMYNSSDLNRRAYIMHLIEDGTKFNAYGTYAKSYNIQHDSIINTARQPLIGAKFRPIQ